VQIWGVLMVPRKKILTQGEVRVNLHLPPRIAKKFDDYCMKVANQVGHMPFGLNTAIARKAIDEWLTVHADDVELILKFMKEERESDTT